MPRRPLRFGFSSLGLPSAELEGMVALAREHCLEVIELRALAGSLDLAGQLRARFGEPARLADWRHEHARDLAFPVVDASFRLSDGTEGDFDALRVLAPWAEALGARWLRVFDGPDATRRTALDRIQAWMAAWAQFQAGHGCRVGLAAETHDSVLDRAAIARLTEAAPTLGIVWDAYHTWSRGREDPLTTWEGCAERIVHVHVKDGRRPVDAAEGAPYLLPGRGAFPALALLDHLGTHAFAGAVVLEWERHWHPALPPLDQALSAAESAWFTAA